MCIYYIHTPLYQPRTVEDHYPFLFHRVHSDEKYRTSSSYNQRVYFLIRR